ncbi:hypothetical protein CERZMDRAFT_85438 [Cercospora zeae-maydis SCOH1-5]|uniref:Uncharacterized protein n=1 Tax=Cercospora zeae-maydis SCOH1-5 TaxID=717836 RepID=A0A6A6FDD1_9PEZI|nr:hypothetical protein CERZMDRAFT_85438 [Cercospora zeae-maydis SCOH1-5]
MVRYVQGLNTDDDSDVDPDIVEIFSRPRLQKCSFQWKSSRPTTQLRSEEAPKEYNWQKEEDKCLNDLAPDCKCAACAYAEGRAGYDGGDSEWSDAEISDSESLAGICDADLEAVESDPRELKRPEAFAFTGHDWEEDIERQFYLFYGREKAKILKPQFHAADIEPGAMERYAELQQFQEESRRINYKSSYMRGKWAQTLMWLGVH